MIRLFSKKISVLLIALVLFAGFTSSSYAEEPEVISGIVVVVEDAVVLDTEFGEVVVKKGAFDAKLKAMDGALVTIEGVVTETQDGVLQVAIKSIVE